MDAIFWQYTSVPQLYLSVELSPVFSALAHDLIFRQGCEDSILQSLPRVYVSSFMPISPSSELQVYVSKAHLISFPWLSDQFWISLPVYWFTHSELQPEDNCSIGLLHSSPIGTAMAPNTQGQGDFLLHNFLYSFKPTPFLQFSLHYFASNGGLWGSMKAEYGTAMG